MDHTRTERIVLLPGRWYRLGDPANPLLGRFTGRRVLERGVFEVDVVGGGTVEMLVAPSSVISEERH